MEQPKSRNKKLIEFVQSNIIDNGIEKSIVFDFVGTDNSIVFKGDKNYAMYYSTFKGMQLAPETIIDHGEDFNFVEWICDVMSNNTGEE